MEWMDWDDGWWFGKILERYVLFWEMFLRPGFLAPPSSALVVSHCQDPVHFTAFRFDCSKLLPTVIRESVEVSRESVEVSRESLEVSK